MRYAIRAITKSHFFTSISGKKLRKKLNYEDVHFLGRPFSEKGLKRRLVFGGQAVRKIGVISSMCKHGFQANQVDQRRASADLQ